MVNPTLYLLFLGIAVPTVLTPGPGVLMSLTNSIRLGVPRATPGIIGVALGTLMIAALSATGLGVILAASPTAYNVIKLAGMVFMLYLALTPTNPTGRSSCFCRFPTHCLSGSFIPVTAGWGTKPQSAL